MNTHRVISAVSVETDGSLFDRLSEHVNIPDQSNGDHIVDTEADGMQQVEAISTNQRSPGITEADLAKHWGIWFGDSKADDASNDAGRSTTNLASNGATILNEKEPVEISSVFKVAVCQHDVPASGIGW